MAQVTVQPPTLDFEIVRGDTLAFTTTLTDANYTPLDLSGWSVANGQNKTPLKNSAGATVGYLDVRIRNQVANPGQLYFYLHDGDSTAISAPVTYDVEISKEMVVPDIHASNLQNVVITALRGTFTTTEEVSSYVTSPRGELA